jgi:hypothetical protein
MHNPKLKFWGVTLAHCDMMGRGGGGGGGPQPLRPPAAAIVALSALGWKGRKSDGERDRAMGRERKLREKSRMRSGSWVYICFSGFRQEAGEKQWRRRISAREAREAASVKIHFDQSGPFTGRSDGHENLERRGPYSPTGIGQVL